MKSHEVLRKTIQSVGVKSVAADMHLAPSLIYKWCEPSESAEAGGAQNPLDRVLKIYELTGDTSPIEWLCRKTDGFRVDNPKRSEHRIKPVLKSTQAILKEFSDILEAISLSYESDGKIDVTEAGRIRDEWEKLKGLAESFVTACEHGTYT